MAMALQSREESLLSEVSKQLAGHLGKNTWIPTSNHIHKNIPDELQI